MDAIIFDLDHTLFAGEGLLHDGVADLLAIVRRLGIKVAGLSSADHRVLVRLDEAGIREFFDHILCAEQTLIPKHSGGVYHLLSMMQAAPEHTALVSHAHADILLSKDAGLAKAIGVSHGSLNAGPLHEAGADHVVENVPAVLDVLQ